MLKSKLHGAWVTSVNTEYEGSLQIDSALMDRARILPFEQVQVYNISNGHRFTTYAITGEAGSGVICVNGAAARLASPRDRIIVATYAVLDEEEIKSRSPQIIRLDQKNRPIN